MQKFLKGSLKSKCLADIIDEIDSGAAVKNIDKSIDTSIKLREAKFKNKEAKKKPK